MIVVRSVQPHDLDALFHLAGQTGEGMTSFKPDRPALTARIERVRRTISGEAPLADQGYLFVMEDTASGRVVGVCGLEVAVGMTQPFYNYRVGTVVHASREMNVWTRMSLLYMSHDLTGYAELCSLFLEPAARINGNGALLSKSRFMFLAQFPDRFGERICAEMRGHFNEAGESPFWRDVGSHFYQIGFDDADYLSAHGKKSFMAELMPRSPVYVDLLPQDVQEAIGKTHKDTEPARVLLEAEGLRFENHVDIFDAGPVLEAHIDNLRAVRESRLVSVVVDDAAASEGEKWLASGTDMADFRVILLPRPPQDNTLRLTPAEAGALNITTGQHVRVLPLYPTKRT
ncbi:arginine N-succinyltransferase subunit beta [Silvimonas iriomotensis]|uniref:Arginine N-succinyltransferase subunit beta n=2 Tax=Silvimonas iriomotensis TaxID=449662 RepID=A0ABQ2P3T4_9NEIS|nr:arginine N-succinyltransferase subunit beta [Silvimonas iriomotensis]